MCPFLEPTQIPHDLRVLIQALCSCHCPPLLPCSANQASVGQGDGSNPSDLRYLVLCGAVCRAHQRMLHSTHPVETLPWSQALKTSRAVNRESAQGPRTLAGLVEPRHELLLVQPAAWCLYRRMVIDADAYETCSQQFRRNQNQSKQEAASTCPSWRILADA